VRWKTIEIVLTSAPKSYLEKVSRTQGREENSRRNLVISSSREDSAVYGEGGAAVICKGKYERWELHR
jgi:hypothetical protein